MKIIMQRKLLFVLAFAGLFASANAQVSVTPEVGIGANMRTNLVDNKWKPTVKVGAAVEFPVSGVFSFQTGLYYMQKGFSDITPAYSNASARWMENVTVKRHLLQVPIMAKLIWQVGEKTSLFWAGGMYIGGCVGTSTTRSRMFAWYDSENGDWTEIVAGTGYVDGTNRTNEDIFKERYTYDKNFDWGVSSNVGVEVNKVVMKAGYDLSLGKESELDNISANYHTLSLSVGYKFNIGK